MNVITIELCAEDRARLDKIIDALSNRPDCSGCVAGDASVFEKASDIIDAPVVETPAPVTDPEPVKRTVTLEQIQKKATQIAAGSAEKKAALRALVNKYAVKVTDLPEFTWTEVWDGLCELEGEV